MQPRSYLIFKWVLYTAAVFVLSCLQYLVFNRVRIMGTTPFLYPALAALVPMFEGKRQGPVFSLLLGLVCDLLLPGPFPGFFCIDFTLVALLSAAVGEGLIAPGFFAGIVVSAMGLILTGVLRVLLHVLSGGGFAALMCQTALYETILTLPAAAVAMPVLRAIHSRCAVEY